jgi:Tfp pilus assembly PilM family ATPase
MAFLGKRRKKNYFALVFSDQEIQLVQANQKGEAVLTLVIKIEPGVIERGWLKKPEGLIPALEKLLSSRKLKKKFVAVGLPETAAFSRVLNLPDLPPEELDDAVRWQSEPLLPMPADQACLDWMLLEKAEKTNRVLVMAFPAKLIEDYARILEDLGFQPIAFEPTSLSLSRLVGRGEESSLAVEVGEKEAVLVAVGPHGEIELSSTASFKEGNGEEELFSTIENLLSFYQKKAGKEKQIKKIFLCGRRVNENLVSQIKAKTKLETQLFGVKPIELATAVSLTRKDVAAPIDEKTINLIPPRIQGVYDLAEKSRNLSNWIKFWLFSLFLMLFSFAVTGARVYFDLKRIEGKIIDCRSLITPQMEELAQRSLLINAKARRVLALSDSQKEFVSLLDLIREAVPEDVAVNHYSVDFEKKEIFINGNAAHRDQLLVFRNSLEETKKFIQVRIPLSSLEKEENVNFTIFLSQR